MRYEYKVERISSFLEKYLNEKARKGWRCVSVMAATESYLKWTQIAVFERIVEDPDEHVNNDIVANEENTKDIVEDVDDISDNEGALENMADIQSVVLDCNKRNNKKIFYYVIYSILLILYIIALRFLNNILNIL